MHSVIAHPHHPYRVGDFLLQNFLNPNWTHFRAAVAFVKKSGTQYIHEALTTFAATRSTNISIGLDHGGSSVEGFNQLMNAVNPNGQIWVYKNSANTFHPKVYLFKNATSAELVVGSANLTKGGLYENAELSVKLQLDLTTPADLKFLQELEATLDIWSTAQPKRCLAVDAPLILELHASGDLPTEAEAASAIKASKSNKLKKVGNKKSPFNSSAVNPAPHLVPSGTTSKVSSTTAVNSPPNSVTQAPLPMGMGSIALKSSLRFAMTLQKTDVGVGQTTTGTSKRSPEIFIPIGAVDLEPTFWGWASRFVPDSTKYKSDLSWKIQNAKWINQKLASHRTVPRPLEKLDWEHVKVNLVGHNGLLDVAVWFNPKKIDIRFRESTLRSAGDIDDILVIEHAPPGANYDYKMEVVPKLDPRYSGLYAALTHIVPSPSHKKFGYF